MANVQIKDGAEAEKYLKSTGAGSDGDAYIPQHLETNSGDIKTAVETVASAVSTQMQVDIVASLPAGTAEIGKLAAGSANIGDVDIASIATNTNSIGKLGTANPGIDIGNVTSLLATDSLRNGTTAVTPAFVAINASSSGDNTLLAAAGSSNKIRVLALNIVVGAAVNVRLESGAGGTAMTGIYEFNGKGDGIVLPFSPVGWFETAANTLLNLELSGAVSVDGSFTYVVVQ